MGKDKSKTNKKEEETTKISSKYEGKEEIILGTFNDVPAYCKQNEYIKKGYRLNCDSISKSLKSLFILHNESVNIWSHLIGAILFVLLIFYTIYYITNYATQLMTLKKYIIDIEKTSNLFSNYDNSDKIKQFYNSLNNFKTDINGLNSSIYVIKKKENLFLSLNNAYESMINNIGKISGSFSNFIDFLKEKYSALKQNFNDLIDLDYYIFYRTNNFNSTVVPKKNLERWPIIVFLTSAILCLLFSATFHLLLSISVNYHRILSRFDYGGIIILITGSCYPPYIYYFYCDEKWKFIYVVFITIFGVSSFLLCLTNGFNMPNKRVLRGSLFLIFGISAGIPIIQMLLFPNTINGVSPKARTEFWIIGGVIYIVGGCLYIIRYPEKKHPGKFDFFGSSHQLLHFSVVIGASFQYLGCLDAYYSRFEYLCYNFSNK